MQLIKQGQSSCQGNKQGWLFRSSASCRLDLAATTPRGLRCPRTLHQCGHTPALSTPLPNLIKHLQNNTNTERSIHRGCPQAGTTGTWVPREVAGRNLQARKEPSTGSVGTAALGPTEGGTTEAHALPCATPAQHTHCRHCHLGTADVH